MSWQEKADKELVITTGDGQVFNFMWKDPEKEVEYNISLFEYPEVEGTFVDRKKRKGSRIPLTLFFVGEQHVSQYNAFEDAADDERHWVMNHPYYGRLNVQPIRMHVDHTGGNVSKINIEVIETIVENNPKSVVNPKDKIVSDGLDLNDQLSEHFAVVLPQPKIADAVYINKNLTKVYEEGRKKVKLTVDADKYFELFSIASNAVLKITSKPLEIMRLIQAMINAPFQFIDLVKNRIALLKSQFGLLRAIAETATKKSDKIIYETMAGNVVCSIAMAAVTTTNDTLSSEDYVSKNDVLEAIDNINEVYDQYVEDIDSMASETGSDEDSFVPDPVSMSALQALVNYTVSMLLSIALDGKQERGVVLEEDSNIIVLAHRFYGLEVDDSTIEYLIKTNNLGMNDLLIIKKGRLIIYYV